MELTKSESDFLNAMYKIVYNRDGTERISVDRLRELAEADSKGLVRILPYSVLAYKIYAKRNRHGNTHKRIVECINYGFPESEIGKTVFLTRESAEAALKAGDTP
ncbi:hypothetical protein DSECCO2_396980 [anaerobic digester metagenome]